jgi:hypothetical protein
MMTKQRATSNNRLLGRTAKALGKFFSGMITLPERHPLQNDEVYPRFPWF